MTKDEQREALLKKPCYVIDILPVPVPKEYTERFLAVEQYFLTRQEQEKLAEKWVRLILKLLCYFDGEAYVGKWLEAVSCRALAARIHRLAEEGRGEFALLLPKENALLQLNGGDLHLTVYHPSARLQAIVRKLAAAEGLFWREGGR